MLNIILLRNIHIAKVSCLSIHKHGISISRLNVLMYLSNKPSFWGHRTHAYNFYIRVFYSLKIKIITLIIATYIVLCTIWLLEEIDYIFGVQKPLIIIDKEKHLSIGLIQLEISRLGKIITPCEFKYLISIFFNYGSCLRRTSSIYNLYL